MDTGGHERCKDTKFLKKRSVDMNMTMKEIVKRGVDMDMVTLNLKTWHELGHGHELQKEQDRISKETFSLLNNVKSKVDGPWVGMVMPKKSFFPDWN